MYTTYYNASQASEVAAIDQAIAKIKVGTKIDRHGHPFYNCSQDDHDADGVTLKTLYHYGSKNVIVCSRHSGRVLLKHKIKNDISELKPHLNKVAERIKKRKQYRTFEEWADYIDERTYTYLTDYTGCDSDSIKEEDKKNKIQWFHKGLEKIPLSKRRQFYRGLSFTGPSPYSYEYDSYGHPKKKPLVIKQTESKERKAFLAKHKVGSICKIDCVTSISSNRSIAQGFSNPYGVMLNIKSHSARRVGCNEDESEFLLLKGSKFLIEDVKIKKCKLTKYNSSGQTVEVFMKEV